MRHYETYLRKVIKMKRAIKFIKRHYEKITLAVIIIVAAYIGFDIMHEMATAERGYNAIGGEVFGLLIPFMCYVALKNTKETKEALKK